MQHLSNFQCNCSKQKAFNKSNSTRLHCQNVDISCLQHNIIEKGSVFKQENFVSTYLRFKSIDVHVYYTLVMRKKKSYLNLPDMSRFRII
jgi:hypothetical protein